MSVQRTIHVSGKPLWMKIISVGALLFSGLVIGYLIGIHRDEVEFHKGSIDSPDRSRRATSEDELTQNQTQTTSQGGAVYTHWGRRQCPLDSDVIYTGTIGGGHNRFSGAVANYLCLPEEPEYAETMGSSNAQIYGAEFKLGDYLLSRENSPMSSTLQDQDATCAVCQSKRPSQVMIPGRTSCVPGWTMEYRGYLMASRNEEMGNKAAICVDRAPEVDRKGAGAAGGATLWPVSGMCGALPCPGYIHSKELTCVVCTR